MAGTTRTTRAKTGSTQLRKMDKIGEVTLGEKTGSPVQDNLLVRVKSNVFGKLIYVNKRNGEKTVWDGVGDVQIMTIGDLRMMRAEQNAFYRNQWILILGPMDGSGEEITCADIYDALGIKQYYVNYIDPSDLSGIISWDDAEIEERISMLSRAQRDNLIVALNTYIENGRLDSIRKIRTFEKALGVELFRND